jgi:hypothetical protein
VATNPFEGKPIPELLVLLETQEVGTTRHEQLKMTLIGENTKIVAGSLERLRESFQENAKSNDRLGAKVYWLNVILTVATVVGSVVAVLQFWLKP